MKRTEDVEAVSYRDRESALVALCDLYKKRRCVRTKSQRARARVRGDVRGDAR